MRRGRGEGERKEGIGRVGGEDGKERGRKGKVSIRLLI